MEAFGCNNMTLAFKKTIFKKPIKTMALSTGSPAIDIGKQDNAPTTDQRGLPRKNKQDAGAF